MSSLFPSLEALVVMSNPLTNVCPTDQHFPNLKSLNLNETGVNRWESVEHLSGLRAMSDLCLWKVPLGADLEEKYRRFATIARLPLLQRLNKSSIGAEEREDAERWLIRQFDGQPEHTQPLMFRELVTKHGVVNRLADVDLSPRKKATVEFHFDERDMEVHTIALRQSTKQLKSWISKHILQEHVPSSKMRLLYADTECLELYGLEEMKYDYKLLHSYDMKDGDQIHVQIRK